MENKWMYEIVSVDLIDEASLNANKMSEPVFNQLVKNISKSGFSSTITCYKKNNGRFVIISGHHRFKACLKNNITDIPCIYAHENDLSNDEKTALQLSHNSIHGNDDISILERLFGEIQSLEFKEFASIEADQIPTINLDTLSTVPITEHYSMSVILYKNDLDTLQELLEIVEEKNKINDIIILANQDNTEDILLKLNGEISKKYNIKSTNVSFCKILELAKKQLKNEDLVCNN